MLTQREENVHEILQVNMYSYMNVNLHTDREHMTNMLRSLCAVRVCEAGHQTPVVHQRPLRLSRPGFTR